MGVFEVVLGFLFLLSPMLVWWAVLKFKNRNLPKYEVKYDDYEFETFHKKLDEKDRRTTGCVGSSYTLLKK